MDELSRLALSVADDPDRHVVQVPAQETRYLDEGYRGMFAGAITQNGHPTTTYKPYAEW